MPRAPPVTNARFPERSITAPPQCGMANAECGMSMEASLGERPPNSIPHSPFRIPHSCPQALLHQFADQMLDREMNLLNARRVVRRDHERDRSEEHTSELQSLAYLVCRLLLEKKKKKNETKRMRSTYDLQNRDC